MLPKRLDFRSEAVAAIARRTGLDETEVSNLLTTPPRLEMGDLAFPTFPLAKKLRKAPPAIAAELARDLAGELTLFEKAEAAGPYVNLSVKRGAFAEAVLREAIAAGADFGRSAVGRGKTIVIDYSSPNIAKPFHVGHLRSTIIGGALYRLFGALGYTTVGINHLGDWGTQFGKQIVGLKRWGSGADLKDLEALKELYVRYHKEEERDPGLTEEAREWETDACCGA